MSEKVEALMTRLETVASVFGWPVDRDRPFDLEEDVLPRVSIWTGGEESVDEGRAADWCEEVDINPVIEVLIEEDDPEIIGAIVRDAWNTLRAAIRAENWREVTVSGSVPRYSKTQLTMNDKPGVSGFAVALSFRVELD